MRPVAASAVVTSVVVALCAGCTTGSGAARPTASQSPRASASSVGCVEATGKDTAHDGVISAGPFRDDQNWTAQGGKLWVETSVEQDRTGAVIRAERTDGAGSPVVVRRGWEERATPDVDGFTGLFFPGAIRLPRKGTWRIRVTIGADSGCFLMTVS